METIKNIFAWIFIALVTVLVLGFMGLNIYCQIAMQEKIMAIPSDGNIETIGE